MKLGKCGLTARWICFLLGVALCGLGAALCTRPDLGTSPIAAPPYVMTFVSSLTFGTWTVILNALCLLGQVAILGRKFEPIQLIQMVAALVLGVAIDAGMWLTDFWVPEAYWLRMLELILGCLVTAIGIAMEIAADVTFLPGDGFIHVVVSRWKLNFGMVKIVFDVALVILAVLIGWLGAGKLHGIREGTLAAAFLVGWFIRLLQKPTTALKLMLKVTR